MVEHVINTKQTEFRTREKVLRHRVFTVMSFDRSHKNQWRSTSPESKDGIPVLHCRFRSYLG